MPADWQRQTTNTENEASRHQFMPQSALPLIACTCVQHGDRHS
jgi:hypothetical protein